MKEKAEHILTFILIILILPCAMTLLLGGRMKEIYRTIKNETDYILLKTNGGTLELELEEYVIGAAAAQIPLGYDLEAVKAQMVAVRTNLCRQIQQDGEVTAEKYMTMEELERAGAAEKFLRAQRATRGQILTWEDEPVLASFHAVSAGSTRDGAQVFQSEEYPYLVSRTCPSDEDAPGAISVIEIDSSWSGMEIAERDSAGYVLQIKMQGEVMSGEEFRSLLGLPSSAFDIQVQNGVFLTVRGIGHGLGMSQYTAQQMALTGKSYTEILGYFYPGTQLTEY
ncbi:MAG: SpoIID/LytB domain-containing protein [Eubacteriales bacterium]|nr:SpoIID/LytB domain-containing protein [Eubacteriales bacterium]